MPNETNNTLIIRGDNTAVENFILLHKLDINDHLYWDFNKSIPVEEKKYIEKWGTYRIGILNLLDKKNGIVMFQTPITPCLKWFEKIVEKYPDLNFSYYYSDEYQEEFYGWSVGIDGKILDGKQICLHVNKNVGGVDLYKYNDGEKHLQTIRENYF